MCYTKFEVDKVRWNEIFSKQEQPTVEQIEAFVNSKLWNQIDCFLQQSFKSKPKIEHSGCSWQPGWNVKYKKNGKSLCTLYPMVGYFIALVNIGEAEMDEAKVLVSFCNEYVQRVFTETKVGIGRKSMMFDIKDEETLKAVIGLIELRAKALGFKK